MTIASIPIHFGGRRVAEILRDPAAESPEWHSHASHSWLDDGRHIDIPAQSWGRTEREARMSIAAYIRRHVSGFQGAQEV